MRIWTLPTSSEDSFFDPVVSAVAFVYPAFTRHCPGHSVVRAAGAKHSSDHEDHLVIEDSPVSIVSLFTTTTR